MTEFFIGFVVGIAAFWFYSLYKAHQLLKAIYHHSNNFKEQNTRKIKIEEHNGVKYAYCDKTDVFLCRFESVEDLYPQLTKIDPKAVWTCEKSDVESITNGKSL